MVTSGVKNAFEATYFPHGIFVYLSIGFLVTLELCTFIKQRYSGFNTTHNYPNGFKLHWRPLYVDNCHSEIAL